MGLKSSLGYLAKPAPGLGYLPLIPKSHSCFPLTNASLFSKFVSLLLFCRYTHLHYILDPTYKWYMAFAFSF